MSITLSQYLQNDILPAGGGELTLVEDDLIVKLTVLHIHVVDLSILLLPILMRKCKVSKRSQFYFFFTYVSLQKFINTIYIIGLRKNLVVG